MSFWKTNISVKGWSILWKFDQCPLDIVHMINFRADLRGTSVPARRLISRNVQSKHKWLERTWSTIQFTSHSRLIHWYVINQDIQSTVNAIASSIEIRRTNFSAVIVFFVCWQKHLTVSKVRPYIRNDLTLKIPSYRKHSYIYKRKNNKKFRTFVFFIRDNDLSCFNKEMFWVFFFL